MKKNIMFITLASAFLILSACGTATDENGEDPTTGSGDPGVENNEVNNEDNSEDNENGTETDSEMNEDKADNESESEADENNSDDESENTNDEDLDKITATGKYNGQADPHTIEIETEDGPLAFQLTMDARDDVDQLTVDEEVTYTYTEDGNTRTIESVQPSE